MHQALVNANEEMSTDFVQVENVDGMAWLSNAVLESMQQDHVVSCSQAPVGSDCRKYNKSDACLAQMLTFIYTCVATRRGVLNMKTRDPCLCVVALPCSLSIW